MLDDAGGWARPSQGLLGRTHRLLATLLIGYTAVAGGLAAALQSPLGWAAEARASGVAGLVLGGCLVAVSSVAACCMANGARRALRPARIEGSGRIAQGLIVPLLAGLAGLCAWGLRAHATAAPDPAVATGLASITALLAFPALVAERFATATPASVLPEAPALRRVLAVPVAAFLVAGALEVLRGQEFAWAGTAADVAAALLAAVAAELAVRGALRWFQPPTDPLRARAAVRSVLADLPRWGLRPGGVAEPLRAHFGLDFSRSWALLFLRRALLPACALTGLACWGLSGVVLLPLDSRGVYERFGAPAAVFGPGLHLTLPWPLGRVRPVELGTVHSVPLRAGPEIQAAAEPAEAPAPTDADRLWDQPHPNEADWLIAGSGASGQSFQAMSADIRVLYRVGLADADALHALYDVADPELLVREVAARTVSRFFAARTLESVLDERVERMSAELQASLTSALRQDQSGLEVVSVTIEAVHPPAGAAAAYHAVQAAEIIANTAIATETGRAKGTASLAREQSWDILDKSRAAAAETVAAARGDELRFTGDVAANGAGGRAFLLERYFQAVTAALVRAPLTIMDDRLAPSMAPVIDLRPFAAAARATGLDDTD